MLIELHSKKGYSIQLGLFRFESPRLVLVVGYVGIKAV